MKKIGFQHRTSNFQGRLEIVFRFCFIRYALLVGMVTVSSLLSTTVRCETDNVKTGLSPLAPDESRALLERLGSMREDIRTLQADFAEERSIPSLGASLKYEGRIYYQYDGFFFMEYTKPLHHILRVLKNEALFFVEGSSNADLVDLSSVNGIAGNPNIFVLDAAKFTGQVLVDNDLYILKEKKKDEDKNGPAPELTVFLEKKSLQVKKIVIEDESGDVTEISLSNVQTNLDIPNSVLLFELPEGVKINRLSQP